MDIVEIFDNFTFYTGRAMKIRFAHLANHRAF